MKTYTYQIYLTVRAEVIAPTVGVAESIVRQSESTVRQSLPEMVCLNGHNDISWYLEQISVTDGPMY